MISPQFFKEERKKALSMGRSYLELDATAVRELIEQGVRNLSQISVIHDGLMMPITQSIPIPSTEQEGTAYDFSFSILRNVSFPAAALMGCRFVGTDLSHSSFAGARLNGALFTDARLHRTDFRGAFLSHVFFDAAYCTEAKFYAAKLNQASFVNANLSHATFVNADLTGTKLNNAKLTGTDFSSSAGLLDPALWLNQFEHDERGVIVYRYETLHYGAPAHWEFKPGLFLTEVCNMDRACDCGCGVSFATPAWLEKQTHRSYVWKCRINWIDLAGVCVPYNTDGKARCSRLELLDWMPLSALKKSLSERR